MKCFLVLLLSLVSAGRVSAQVREEWVARYNGPASGHDAANAMALDAAGSVYVTGGSTGVGTGLDYATVKYDSDGNELWVARYNGPGNGDDYAAAMALDAAGNVYVTGWSWGLGTDYDYATVKYDSDGNELWVARYNGRVNSSDAANAMALDAAGNVYVTGSSAGVGTQFDYATVKYDSDGNEQWVARYDGTGKGNDFAYAIALDAAGNAYVTGQSWGVGTQFDYATVKYDSGGNEQWVARYNGPGNGLDVANALTVDAAGNVYVTGQSWGIGTQFDYATVKYNSDGNELWVARYNGPDNGDDVALAMALDAAGDVYVTGSSLGVGTGMDYATLKYDLDGKELWVARYNGPASDREVATAIALDAVGNAYVTGGSTGVGTGLDYATVKYDLDGKELWVARYNGPGNGSDAARAIALDAAADVYVTGRSEGGVETANDYATVKYSQQ